MPPVQGPVAPWWRHPMVWLVIAGPLLVVVAGFLTLYLAVTNGDQILDAQDASAVHARNHAATGGR